MSAEGIVGQYDVEISANSVISNKWLDIQVIEGQLELAMRAGPDNVTIAPLLTELFERQGNKRVNEIVVPADVSFMRILSKDPAKLVAAKQQIDELITQLPPEIQSQLASPQGAPAQGTPPVTPPRNGASNDVITQSMQQLPALIQAVKHMGVN